MKTPLFLFAPGAGAPSSHSWMQGWKKRLESLGRVEMFDYDYMRSGRKRPDPLPQLIAAHRQALARARQNENEPTFLIGKSMGGRIGCHVALEENGERSYLHWVTRFVAVAILPNFATKSCASYGRRSCLFRGRATLFVLYLCWRAFAPKCRHRIPCMSSRAVTTRCA